MNITSMPCVGKSYARLEMLIMPTDRPDHEVIGLQPIPNQLERIDRLPGETFKAMAHRALHAAKGTGVLLVFPVLKDSRSGIDF
jgi:hypothetical protein